MEMSEKLQALAREKAAILQGDAERIAKQHADGKCTARERAVKLFDAGSFVEIDALRENSHAVAGCGTVSGQAVYCFAQDFASCGGAMGLSQATKIIKVLDKARIRDTIKRTMTAMKTSASRPPRAEAPPLSGSPELSPRERSKAKASLG